MGQIKSNKRTNYNLPKMVKMCGRGGSDGWSSHSPISYI